MDKDNAYGFSLHSALAITWEEIAETSLSPSRWLHQWSETGGLEKETCRARITPLSKKVLLPTEAILSTRGANVAFGDETTCSELDF